MLFKGLFCMSTGFPRLAEYLERKVRIFDLRRSSWRPRTFFFIVLNRTLSLFSIAVHKTDKLTRKMKRRRCFLTVARLKKLPCNNVNMYGMLISSSSSAIQAHIRYLDTKVYVIDIHFCPVSLFSFSRLTARRVIAGLLFSHTCVFLFPERSSIYSD